MNKAVSGASWVAQPGGDRVKYGVAIVSVDPQVAGIEGPKVETEQFYRSLDPANRALATTRFPRERWYHSPNGPVDVPAAWTRH